MILCLCVSMRSAGGLFFRRLVRLNQLTRYWVRAFYRLAGQEDEMDDRVAKVFKKVLI